MVCLIITLSEEEHTGFDNNHINYYYYYHHQPNITQTISIPNKEINLTKKSTSSTSPG